MNSTHASLLLAVTGSACLIGVAFAGGTKAARVAMATAPAINITADEHTHPAFTVQLAVEAGDLVRVDLTCTLLADNSSAISLRPSLLEGRATALADIPYVLGGINAPSPAAAFAVWKAEAAGNLQFTAETKGTGELVGCSLLATRLP